MRLPEWKRRLSSSELTMSCVDEFHKIIFGAGGALQSTCGLLGLTAHPDLHKMLKDVGKFDARAIRRVVYHTNLSTMYKSQVAAEKFVNKCRDQRAKLLSKALNSAASKLVGNPTDQQAMHNLFRDYAVPHFQKVAQTGSFFSCDMAGSIDIRSLQHSSCADGSLDNHGGPLELLREASTCNNVPRSQVQKDIYVFRLLHSQPARHKVVHSDLDKFNRDDMLISIHGVHALHKATQQLRVDLQAAHLQDGSGNDDNFILRLPNNFSLTQWRFGLLSWRSERDINITVNLPELTDLHEQITSTKLVREMFLCNSFMTDTCQPPGVIHLYKIDDLKVDYKHSAAKLQELRLVHCFVKTDQESSWYITTAGMQRLAVEEVLTPGHPPSWVSGEMCPFANFLHSS